MSTAENSTTNPNVVPATTKSGIRINPVAIKGSSPDLFRGVAYRSGSGELKKNREVYLTPQIEKSPTSSSETIH